MKKEKETEETEEKEQKEEEPEKETATEETEEEKKIEEQKKRIEELTQDLQRVQAEFKNYKKQQEKRMKKFKEKADTDIIKKILPILDNFEIALKTTEEKNSFYKGMEMVYAQLKKILEEKKIEKIETEGEKFDPKLHEAMITEEKEGAEEGEIIEELKKGYKKEERVLRTAKVKVAK